MARPPLPSYNDPGASPANPDGGWVGVIKAAINDVSDRIDSAVSTVTNLATTVALKAADNAVVHLTGTETITGSKTFSSPISAAAPTIDAHLVTRGYYNANLPAGGGSASVVNDPTSTSTTAAMSATATKTAIGKAGVVRLVSAYGSAGTNGYSSIQTPSDADSATVVSNKLASNLAILNACLADANGAPVDGGPDFIALNGDLNYPTGDIKLNLLHWRGSTTASRPIRPALRVLNLFGSEMVMDIGTVQVGQTNPVANVTTWYASSMGQLVAPGGTGIDNQGGYRNIDTTDVGEVYCKDPVPFAAETGLTNTASAATWRAELIGVHGIGLNVSSVSMTSASTVGGGYPYTSFERHTIVGQSSGVTAIANSWAIDTAGGTTGKLIFGSVPGDFRNGENLLDGVGGPVIGVAGQMFVSFAGRLLFDYNLSTRMAIANATTAGTWTAQQIIDARPRFRLMNKARVNLDITVKASHDVDTFLTTTERNIPAVEVDGAYHPKIKVTGLSGYSRLLLVRACEAPDVYELDAVGVANHAIPVASANGEEAYGYGLEVQGPTRYLKFHDSRGSFLRHLFTTNPNSRTWGTTAADGIPDYMGMGCGSMWAEVYDNTAHDCFSAPFDTHEGAWGTRWRNNDVFSSYSGSRVVTQPAGYNSRGFADDYQDCRVNGTVGGFSNGGVALTSGIPYTSVYRNTKATEIQSTPYSFSPFKSGLNQDQSGLLASQQSAAVMHAKVAFHGITSSLDTSLTRTQGLQYGIVCDVGVFDWYGENRFTGANDSPIRIRAGGIHVFHAGPTLDYSTTTTTGSIGIRLDGTSNVTFLEPVKTKMKSTTVPASVVVNISGNSMIAHKGYDGVMSTDTASVQTRPAQPFGTTTAGTPTWTTLTSTF